MRYCVIYVMLICKQMYIYVHDTYLTIYSVWSAMHELSLLLNYQVYR